MRHLSEDIIKKAGIRFLKDHYKFRPRTGNTLTSFDQETADGIITDGQLSYIDEDGASFLATLEATSFVKKNEVLYSQQEKLLFWDSFAYALFFSVIIFALSHHFNWVTINKSGWLLTMLTLAVVLSLGFLLIRFLIKGFQRYRYIYAIEQFKKFHADEQWIAIAEDVFDESTDVYFQELKTQCVQNGFGLISIDYHESARILITPSRQEVFGQSRSNKAFLNRDEYLHNSKTTKVTSLWNKFTNLFTQGNKGRFRRYERSFFSQYLMCLVGIGILSGIFYQEALNAPFAYVNEKEYEKELVRKAKKSKAETTDFYLDSAYVDSDKKKVKPYLEEISLPENEEDWELEISKYFDDSGENYAEIYIASGDGGFLTYDCERFFNYSGTKYLIQEGTYQTVHDARKQLIRLKRKGINANCLWTGCLEDQNMEFIIFIDFLFDKKEDARIILKNVQKRLKLPNGFLKTRSVTL